MDEGEDIFFPFEPPHELGATFEQYADGSFRGVVREGAFSRYICETKEHSASARSVCAFARVSSQDHDTCARRSEGLRQRRDFARIGAISLQDKVILTGYVSQERLPLIVGGARAAVFASLHEGFGFPALEAMACGVPVVTSNVSSLPEVAGDAALLVDPYDTNAMRDAVEHVVIDETFRENLRGKEFVQASRFSWHKTVSSTVALYRTVASQHR